MLRSVKELIGYELLAEDGLIGKSTDFLVDDEHWAVRYMVADVGGLLKHKPVLISPIALGAASWVDQVYEVKLSREMIKSSPSLSEHEPVSRQFERLLHDHHAHPYYWAETTEGVEAVLDEEDLDEPNLRSAKEIISYQIQACDDEVGNISDIIIDDVLWNVRYIIVEVHEWLMQKKFMIAPDWIKQIDYNNRMASIDLYREDLFNCPDYDPSEPINKQYEDVLFDYYGRAHKRRQKKTAE